MSFMEKKADGDGKDCTRRMYQGWSGCEGFFQEMECLGGFGNPEQSLGPAFQEECEKSSDWAVILDEMAIEVCEAKETLKLF